MKIVKNLSLVFAICSVVSFTTPDSSQAPAPESTVYVCGSSKIYHTSRSHTALSSRCTHTIKSMSESTAQSQGKRACKCRN